MTLLSRLDSSSGEWRLPVKINDGTTSIEVDLHDKVFKVNSFFEMHTTYKTSPG